MKIEEMDKNMLALQAQATEELTWHTPEQPLFKLAGFAFDNGKNRFCRLPLCETNLISAVNPALMQLAEHTAGGQLFLRTNSTVLELDVTLSNIASLSHMAAVGQCGFDCYIADEYGNYRFYNSIKYDIKNDTYRFRLFEGLTEKPRDILINFPLYGGVKGLQIGLLANAQLLPVSGFKNNGRVVAYGTSITQGGCASRPGMAYTNILSRKLGIEFINLGFSGNGNGETEMAQILSEIAQTNLLIIDYEANAGVNGLLESTLNPLIDTFRKNNPITPILVLSMINMPQHLKSETKKTQLFLRKSFMIEAVNARKKSGDENIYFVQGDTLLGKDWDECTVDGVHPTDLGFMQMATALAPIIEKLI